MYVPNSMSPLPQDSRFSGSNSGSKPYFDGPKKALCVPIRKTVKINKGSCCQTKPTSTKDITPISNTFTPTVIVRLLNRSARKPPAMENRMKGRENNPVVSGTNASCSQCDSAMFSPTKVTTIFRALSLNAPSNCVRIRLQNPRKYGWPGSADSA